MALESAFLRKDLKMTTDNFEQGNSLIQFPMISVIVTCFNEEISIEDTLKELFAALDAKVASWEVIIFEDASTDNSLAAIESFLGGVENKQVTLINRRVNAGFVKNVFDGAQQAKGKYFWVVSGDSTVPCEAMIALLGNLGKADLIIPYVQSYTGRGVCRKLISWGYSRVVNILSGSNIKYFNGGSLYLRCDFVNQLPNVSGFSYSADMILRLVRLGRSYLEVPVVYREGRKARSTALSLKHLKQIFYFFLRLLIGRLMRVRGR